MIGPSTLLGSACGVTSPREQRALFNLTEERTMPLEKERRKAETHTPGSWIHVHPPGTLPAIISEDGTRVIAERVYRAEDARRIAACVRACELIPTEELEGGVIAAFAAAVSRVMGCLEHRCDLRSFREIREILDRIKGEY